MKTSIVGLKKINHLSKIFFLFSRNFVFKFYSRKIYNRGNILQKQRVSYYCAQYFHRLLWNDYATFNACTTYETLQKLFYYEMELPSVFITLVMSLTSIFVKKGFFVIWHLQGFPFTCQFFKNMKQFMGYPVYMAA